MRHTAYAAVQLMGQRTERQHVQMCTNTCSAVRAVVPTASFSCDVY